MRLKDIDVQTGLNECEEEVGKRKKFVCEHTPELMMEGSI